jgi:hypothetical protein
MESMIPIIFTPNEVHLANNNNNVTSTERENQSSSIYDDDESEEEDDEDDDLGDSVTKNDGNNSWKDWMKRSALISKFAKFSDLSSTNLQDARLQNPNSFAVLLPPRSLIVFSGTLYKNYLHGILENQIDLLPLNKIANLNQLLTDSSTTNVVEFAINPPKNIIDIGDDEQQRQHRKRESKLFHLTLLSEIKSLDRFDMMQRTGLNAEIQKMGQELFFVGDENNSKRDFMIILSKSPIEKYLLSVRQDRRVSLTFRRVL